jgi:hypothetical protein
MDLISILRAKLSKGCKGAWSTEPLKLPTFAVAVVNLIFARAALQFCKVERLRVAERRRLRGQGSASQIRIHTAQSADARNVAVYPG